MIGLLSKKLLSRHGISRRGFCVKPMKFLREKQIKYESKLMEIKDFVVKENIKTEGNIDWNRIVSQMVEQKLVNRINFEVDLMSSFLLNNETDNQMDRKLFESMVKFIKSVPNVMKSDIASSHYYHFISHFHQYIEESDIEMIRKMSEKLMSKYMDNRLTTEVLNPILIGLSKSSKDNCLHSIKLLEQIKRTDYQLIKQIIESALSFKLFDQILDLIEKYSEIKLSEEIISNLINSLSKYNPSAEQMVKLFENLSNNLVVFDSKLKTNLIEIMKSISFKISVTSVAQNGLCLKCEQILKGVSAEEQKTLVKDFESIVFNKENDLLLKSFPEYRLELKKFDEFIRYITSEQPLDLVIDGLNLAFAMNPIVVEDKKNLRKYTQKYPIHIIDANIVELLTKNNIEKYNNILIVGRKHMKEWKGLNQLLYNQKERISIFYAMNKTQDDCYILYGSLKNPNTYIISNDFYRNYSEKMSQKGILFDRWLKTHQIQVSHQNKKFVFPDPFDHKIHISNKGQTIHIPFYSNHNSKIDWICCQK